MSDRSLRLLQPPAACLLLLCVASTALGEEISANGSSGNAALIATVDDAHRVLEWTPAIDHDGISLAVADPQGQVRTFYFARGEAAVLSLVDGQGVPFADGIYTWETRLRPSSGTSPAAAFVQSGHFTVLDGSVVPSDLTEPPEGERGRGGSSGPHATTAADQIVPDDFIVDGKGCIGLGCVNNEAFGAEALRLKQSVVWLRFEDTSTTGGFPARDWQLTANDAASGGADRFSIEDLTAATTPFTIRGGAPNNSVYVDATGQVGLGTATPAVRLHVLANSGGSALYLQNSNPSGFAGVHFVDSGGVADSFFGIRNASPSETWLLSTNRPFVFHMGGYERMRVNGDGNVAIGCNNPGSKLVINANAGVSCTTPPWSAINAGEAAFTTSSSRAVKTNLALVAVPDILERIAGVGVYTFDFLGGPTDKLGLMAEDFHQIFGRGSDQLLNGQEVLMALWLAVQELAERNDRLGERAAKLEPLRRENEALRERLLAVETSLQRVVERERER